jgi:hypothetical protein
MIDGSTGPATSLPAPGDEPLQDGPHLLQAAIGRALQAHYQDLVREPIPDRLLDLLAAVELGSLSHE